MQSQDPLIMWSCKVMGQIKCVVSLLPQDLWPLNLAKMVTHYEGLPRIKSHNLLNTWSFEITWQIKNVLFSLEKFIRPPK